MTKQQKRWKVLILGRQDRRVKVEDNLTVWELEVSECLLLPVDRHQHSGNREIRRDQWTQGKLNKRGAGEEQFKTKYEEKEEVHTGACSVVQFGHTASLLNLAMNFDPSLLSVRQYQCINYTHKLQKNMLSKYALLSVFAGLSMWRIFCCKGLWVRITRKFCWLALCQMWAAALGHPGVFGILRMYWDKKKMFFWHT